MGSSEKYEVDAYRLDAYIPERLVEEAYGWRTLARLAAKRGARRFFPARFRQDDSEQIVANFAGLAVLDRPQQHKGGLASGQDFPRVLNELGIGRCKNLYEFCAGPGYIGFALLAGGWCENLTLSDIDPSSVATARRTVAMNGIEDRVKVFQSDVLDQIPADSHWNVVVANPPHFLPDPQEPKSIQRFDPDWEVHRRFYASIKAHMEPGGFVVMAENSLGSDPEVFARMIIEGGGSPVAIHPGTLVDGRPNGTYYQVSEW